MRRAISLSLLMMFGWLLIAPFLAPDAEANIPACCRRHGKHHCMMNRIERLGSQKRFTAVSEKCPRFPTGLNAAHSAAFKPDTGARFYAEVVRHPACSAQTDALYHIAFARSHQKRGPPALVA
jgi:hypothetical protein